MFNKIILCGNLTRDIELRYLQNGTAIGKSAIAVTRKFNGTNGEKKEETCFIDIDFWGRTAEIASQYLRKGSKVLIEGRLKLDQWNDAKTGAFCSKHSVVVESMEILSFDNAMQKQEPSVNRGFDRNANQSQAQNQARPAPRHPAPP